MERTLIYDADCGFCTQSAEWLAKSGHVHIKPWQQIDDLSSLGLTSDMVNTAAYWADGIWPLPRGESAIAHALVCRGGIWKIVGRILLAPPILAAAGTVYRFIAKNRHRMPGGTAACKL